MWLRLSNTDPPQKKKPREILMFLKILYLQCFYVSSECAVRIEIVVTPFFLYLSEIFAVLSVPFPGGTVHSSQNAKSLNPHFMELFGSCN